MGNERTTQFKILLSGEEKFMIDVMAARAGLTPTDYVRSLPRERFAALFGPNGRPYEVEGKMFVVDPSEEDMGWRIRRARDGAHVATLTRRHDTRHWDFDADWRGVPGRVPSEIAKQLGVRVNIGHPEKPRRSL